ncbi:hypothetical protein [uncultured Flavobacterium sp.]|uniref:hypothetical protein n=1 Tax=uncultured Flavobacterium sp. TaxID=165435 RepID=UPI0025DECB94|nr:hypothetical protein [uncultured Flavobacterium sp.]
MRTAAKIILAGVVGTTFMTLYSYIISKREKQEFTEPVLLNKLMATSENLPEIDNDKKHPAGWLAHYGVGVLFVTCYWFLWRRSLRSPGIVKGLLVGAASGVVAIISWKLMFAANDNPPKNDRYRYYRQLFIAHLIFSILALFGYKLPDYVKRLSA